MSSALRNITVLCLVVYPLLGVSSASADIYRYVDAEGRVHFTDTPTHGRYTFYRKMANSGSPAPQVRSYLELIKRNAAQFNLDEALVKAVIKVESDYQPNITSHKGAQGLMQLIPETARDMQVVNPYDTADNIRGGTRYLRRMQHKFTDDV